MRALATVLFVACSSLPPTKTVGTRADDFAEATQAAVDLWNGWVGCDFLIAGEDIIVKSDDGAPCGDHWRPEPEWDHAATAYDCGSHWEILVSQPGDLHDQLCVIAHEIGHALGRHHQSHGVMAKGCDSFLRISDSDTNALRRDFCR
jgi:predicted Zn-dependent protease